MTSYVKPAPWTMQEFERDLLLKEVVALSGSEARWQDDLISLRSPLSASRKAKLVRRLSFASSVSRDGVETETIQRRLEKAAGSSQGRKVTSHALHGLHPYKGKFYPQLARSILNAYDVKRRGRVLDPFAGCGTTLLEASLVGQQARGLDANPLGVFVANTKLALLRSDPEHLRSELDALKSLPRVGVPLPDPYLENWFPPANLAYLLRLLNGIRQLPPEARAVALVVLSSVLRDASFQDPAQIRVYRRKDEDSVPELRVLFSEALERALSQTRATSDVLTEAGLLPGKASVSEGDARSIRKHTRGSFDAVVTSPPYANALPYIDTDRLSLRAFSLLSEGGQRAAERAQVGNREISGRELRSAEAEMDDALQRQAMPERLVSVLKAAREVAAESTSGFRKKRTPALLYCYFRDMDRVLSQVSQVLKPGAPAVFVVGDSTVAGPGNTRLRIPTADLVADFAHRHGMVPEDRFTKRLTSFGAKTTRHQRNAMESEDVLVFRKPE